MKLNVYERASYHCQRTRLNSVNGPRADDRLPWLISYWREQAGKDHALAERLVDLEAQAIFHYVGDVREICADELEKLIGVEC